MKVFREVVPVRLEPIIDVCADGVGRQVDVFDADRFYISAEVFPVDDQDVQIVGVHGTAVDGWDQIWVEGVEIFEVWVSVWHVEVAVAVDQRLGLVVELATGEGEVAGGDSGCEAVVEAVEDDWAGEEPVAESVLVDFVVDLAWEAE